MTATLSPLSSLEQARRIAALAADKLAEDVVILDMRPVCVYTDFFVLATGRNARQTKSIYDEVYGQLKAEAKLTPR
ncbi:MAG: RsfS/YbeB/iojap family protein, partial [Actinobacteria bacterium]|nr:RsfS/YbeB/iojap family protein [Actinomycetota bacterium]